MTSPPGRLLRRGAAVAALIDFRGRGLRPARTANRAAQAFACSLVICDGLRSIAVVGGDRFARKRAVGRLVVGRGLAHSLAPRGLASTKEALIMPLAILRRICWAIDPTL